MRRFRNPRYAPESLERKLSPTGLIDGLVVVAAVSTTSPATSTNTPLPGDGLPPNNPSPGTITGPVGPA